MIIKKINYTYFNTSHIRNEARMMEQARQQNSPGTVDQEFLTFTLGDENYALDILTVKEIRGYESPTKIANAPPFIKGVINLRGDIVPIVDLRIKFNVGKATYDEFTIVIVLHIHNRIVGIVVDGVSDVVSLGQDQLRPPPDFGVAFDSRYLLGLATVNEQMIILVDINELISSEEMGLFDTGIRANEKE